MAWNFPKLSRRTFLKTTGLSTAGLSLLKFNPLLSKSAQAATQSESKEEINYTICNFCSSLCNVKVTSRIGHDGNKRVVKLDGNPNSTLNRGKMCARGQAGLRQTYDPDRFKNPLIRVEGSKRGEWKFRDATWEEVWEHIAKKVKDANIQPWEWTMIGGWTSCIFYMNWSVPFAMANAIPNIVASPMQHCVTTGHLGTDAVTGTFNVHDEILPDYDNAKYIVYVGNNSSIAGVSTCRAVRFAQGKKNGAKVVVLDPRLSETAAKADEWVPIRPGTDLDFCLAMLREMLANQLYDAEFLRVHTNMPFLVYKDDNNQWQLVKDKEERPMIVWDGTSDIHILPAYTNYNRMDINGQIFCPSLNAPEGLVVPDNAAAGAGKRAITVLQAQLEEIDFCTPEWAEKTTTIPAATILRITHEFGNSRPALIDPGWHGARFGNVMMTRRVQAMIQALNGGIDKEGGWILSGEFHHKLANQYKAKQDNKELPAPMATKAGMDFALFVVKAFSDGKNFPHGHPGWAWAYSQQQKAEGKVGVALPVLADEGFKESAEGKVMWEGKPYLTRALFVNAANPVRHYYPDTYWKDIMASSHIELVLAVDVLPSDTTPYADIILPNSTYLERSEPTFYGNGVNQDLAITTRYAAIDPLYDSQELPDILLKLTEIISGKPEELFKWMEMLTGLPADATKQRLEQLRNEKDDKGGPKYKSPFMVACRQIGLVETAKRLNITPEELDKVLREKGIYHEEDWRDLLVHTAVPRKLPTTTASGRIEFFSSFFDMLRSQGHNSPHFNVLASHIPAECRAGKTMEQPLEADEFYFSYGKVPTVSYGSTNSNNPVLAAINTFKKDIYTGVWIHPDRANKLNIKNGEKIKLRNTLSGQEAEGMVYVTRKVRPDTLFLHSAFGVENPQLTRSYAMGGTATNKLIPHNVEPVVAGFRSQEFTIKISKV
ncbi:molybdopterin oxidoreductase [Thioploca ingrica]|uniref:Molybdopterin oxidoreductase n=1 Tax=Thioploca ingrica TaxID=40754 RepID=A0A090ACC2_9GAMM|nr:molybdopterin oxidoreductase [Thioploca ingrica]